MDIINDKFLDFEEKIKFFRDLDINIANQFFILDLRTLRKLERISELWLKVIKICYNQKLLFNPEIFEFKELINLSEPSFTISPIRLNFLLNNRRQICLNDINIPSSFVLDMIWPELGLKSLEIEFEFIGKRFVILNAFPRYQKIFSKFFKKITNIHRYLEINTTNTEEGNRFLDKLYRKISSYGFFNLIFNDIEISKFENKIYPDDSLISFFLNTNNTIRNLLHSSKSIFQHGFPIFANPKLIPYMDKRFPSRQFLSTVLKTNELDYIKYHIPREIQDDYKAVIKRRFGNAGEGWFNQYYTQSESEKKDDLIFRQELLSGFKFQGWEFNKKLNTIKKLRGKKFKPNVNVKRNIFELSLNSILITKNDKIETTIPAISFAARGSLGHPISGPHTTIFPILIEKG